MQGISLYRWVAHALSVGLKTSCDCRQKQRRNPYWWWLKGCVMARRRASKRSRGSPQASRRARGVGLVASAGAFFAFGLGPLASAPPVHADVLDVIVDPITQPLQQALAGVTDAVSAIDP